MYRVVATVCVLFAVPCQEFLYEADKKFMTCLLQVAGSLKGKKGKKCSNGLVF